jgi:hypothetical protein
MSALVAGAASGLLMASLFISVAAVMLVAAVKDPPPRLQALLATRRPMALVMPTVVLAYPVWGGVGAVLGLLFLASVERAPGGGLGSPNWFYTVVLVIGTMMLAAPVVVLMRRVALGVSMLAVAFMGIFGWLLPFIAT